MFEKSETNLPWNAQAEQALEQAIAQVPGPKLVAGQVKKRLRSAAEKKAGEAGHTEVTPEDLMQGLMDMLPPSMRETIEKRLSEGPEGISKLQDDLQNSK